MHRQRLVTALAAAFGVMTAIFAVSGLVYSPALLILAALFGVVTYILYGHASGRLMSRMYRGVEQQAATDGPEPERGGFGAGPREEWTPPREQQRRQARRTRRGQQRRQRRQGQQRQRVRPTANDGPTPHEARDVLGVGPGADESDVREAYRDRIKDVHPDADGGDEAEFKRVQEAYEVLTD
ncbi:MAG: putative outer membrane lipoprotein [Haloarculaceae archaeon]